MTTRLFPRSTVILDDIREMSEDQGSPSTNLTAAGNGWSIEHLFRYELSSQLDTAAIPVSFNVTAQGGSSTARFRMQYLRNGGSIIETSNNSDVITTTGVYTQLLTLGSLPTFQPGDIIEMAVEANHSGGGGRNFQFAVNDADTHADVELAEVTAEDYEWPASPLTVEVSDQSQGSKDSSGSITETVGVSDSISGQKTVSDSVSEAVNISVAADGVAVKPPINVVAQEIADNTVQLTWDAVSGAENGYAIERDEVVIAQDVMITEYTDEDVPNGERTYRVGTIV